jgi:CheY-like chemotaxis protein
MNKSGIGLGLVISQ